MAEAGALLATLILQFSVEFEMKGFFVARHKIWLCDLTILC